MAVAHRQGIPLVCVTNGIEGSIELRLTRQMCDALGATHLSCLLEESVVGGIMEGTRKPDYSACVSIVAAAALKEMRKPAALALCRSLSPGTGDDCPKHPKVSV